MSFLPEDGGCSPYSTPPTSPATSSIYVTCDSFSSSSSSGLRSSMASSSAPKSPPKGPQLPAKSAVSETSLLTQEVVDIGNRVVAGYEVVRTQHFNVCPPEVTEANPFSSFSLKELENYYAAAVDTKNVIRLRKDLVQADIGDTLELLLPKLSLYEQDTAILSTALDEINLIQHECSNRQIELNFHALESLRYIFPSHTLSVLEEHYALFSELDCALEQKNNAQQAAHWFLKDPSALREGRLPHFRTSQR